MLERAGVPNFIAEAGSAATSISTIKGFCESPKKGRPCNTVVTCSEIDTMLKLLEPDATAVARQEFAINNARLVAAYAVAEERHLDREPGVDLALQLQEKLVRTQVMPNRLYKQLGNQGSVDSPPGVESCCAAQKDTFEQGNISLLIVPKTMASTATNATDLRARAEPFRSHAASVEDFEKLQAEVYKESGGQTTILPTKLANLRRTMLSEQESKVFDLSPGEICQVLELPSSWVILPLESKVSLSLESVREEIIISFEHASVQAAVQKATLSSDAQFNLNFLGMPTARRFSLRLKSLSSPALLELAGIPVGKSGLDCRHSRGEWLPRCLAASYGSTKRPDGAMNFDDTRL